MNSKLNYIDDERTAVQLLEGIRQEFPPDIFQLSKSLIAHGEWKLALDTALTAALEKGPLEDIDSICKVASAVRLNGGDLDRRFLTLLKQARTNRTEREKP